MQLSARNKLWGRLPRSPGAKRSPTSTWMPNGQRLVASITVEAVEELGLREGTECWAVVKASDVMVGIPHD